MTRPLLFRTVQKNPTLSRFIDPQFSPSFSLGNKKVRGMILPHAGSPYVKEIMDYAFDHIDPQSFDRILVLSTNHGSTENILVTDGYTGKEHSFVSLLPYLEKLNKPYEIFLVGTTFTPQITDSTLVIANTDLLHCGPNYNVACPPDIDAYNRRLIQKIVSGV